LKSEKPELQHGSSAKERVIKDRFADTEVHIETSKHNHDDVCLNERGYIGLAIRLVHIPLPNCCVQYDFLTAPPTLHFKANLNTRVHTSQREK
jgi:hypothetical protein